MKLSFKITKKDLPRLIVALILAGLGNLFFQQLDYIQLSRTSTTDIREMTVKSQFVISHSLYVSN